MASWMHVPVRRRSGLRLVSLARGLPIAALITAVAVAARLPAAEYDSWQKLENADEPKEYVQQIREGKFEGPQQRFLSGTLLPQLALPANRMIIGQVRQRIREIAAQGATQPAIFEGSNALIRDAMVRTARDEAADPLTRVNAMLLIGELQADRKPWKGSVEPLALAAADAKLPLEIRIAALAGLARHATGGDAAFAAQAGPALAAIVTAPPQGDTAAGSWLLARAVDLLPAVQPAAPVIAALARITADDGADLDLRVRAAAAFGKLAARGSGGDPAALIGGIRSVAVAALQRDLAAAEARRFRRQLATGESGAGDAFGGPAVGGPGPAAGDGLFGGLPGSIAGGAVAVDEDAVPVLACRRNAWRLATLADAVKPESGPGGIAALVEGDSAAAAIELASDLRRLAREILSSPDEQTLVKARESLDTPAAAGAPAAAGGQPADRPAEPNASPSPFDDPAVN